MPRPKLGPRVVGPYPHGLRWRVRIVDAEGRRDYLSAETKGEALSLRQALSQELRGERNAGQSVEQAIEAYENHLVKTKGNKRRSAITTAARLRSFFPKTAETLAAQTPERCAAHYDALTKQVTRGGKTLAPDTHRNILSEARTFLGWCVSRGWIPANPLASVHGRGRRRHGKPQLRIDEARRWLAEGLHLAEEARRAGHRPQLEGATIALCTLLIGARASELTSRVVRDLDDAGRLLWITDSKTRAGRRTVAVPPELQPYLLELARGRQPDELLFGAHDRSYPTRWTQRICERAHVPVVGAHSMRGLAATLAVIGGFSVQEASRKLGHEDESTTLRSYADAAEVANARHRQALRVLGREKPDATVDSRPDPTADGRSPITKH